MTSSRQELHVRKRVPNDMHTVGHSMRRAIFSAFIPDRFGASHQRKVTAA